jgi:hypothetical protein
MAPRWWKTLTVSGTLEAESQIFFAILFTVCCKILGKGLEKHDYPS